MPEHEPYDGARKPYDSPSDLTIYQRIKRAAINGRSVRLAAHECYELYHRNAAFRTIADNHDLGRKGGDDADA